MKVSPATVLAGLAVFVSLGGVSYGVATGSINSREIQNGTVQSRDVRDGALKGRDIANGTLRSRDVEDGVLSGVDVRDGSLAGADLATNTLGDREIVELHEFGVAIRERHLHRRHELSGSVHPQLQASEPCQDLLALRDHRDQIGAGRVDGQRTRRRRVDRGCLRHRPDRQLAAREHGDLRLGGAHLRAPAS